MAGAEVSPSLRNLRCSYHGIRIHPSHSSFWQTLQRAEPGSSTSPAATARYQVVLLHIARLVLGERTLQDKDDIVLALIWVFTG